jgi:hypothetical protein
MARVCCIFIRNLEEGNKRKHKKRKGEERGATLCMVHGCSTLPLFSLDPSGANCI